MKTFIYFISRLAALVALALGHVVGASAQKLSCITPPPNMVSWFPGDGNAQDILNNTQDLSVVGGVTFPTGKVAQAFNFDGTGDVTYSTINTGSTYTVDFWLRPTRLGGYENLVSNSYIDGQKYGQLYFVDGRIEYWQGGTFRVGSASASVPLNTYTHVALSYDGSVDRLYLNGNLVATSGVHSETFNNQIRLGYSIGNFDVRFAGQIDEVEIFSRELSQSEIQAIVNADSAGKCKTLVDADGDGVVDSRDACPGTPPGTVVNASGCPLGTCFVPPSGLNNWFPGDGNPQDILNNNDAVSVTGGVTFPAGKVAQAFNFDGTGEVTYSMINTGAAYTVDFWVRPTRSFGYENLVSNSHRDGTQNYGQLYFVDTRVEYWQGGTFRTGSVAGSAPLDTYVHVGLTYDGSVNRLYLNGNLAATSGIHAGETFNNQVRLGSAMDNTDVRFAGQIDEVEIFSRALSQTELRGILNADTVGKCKTVVDADGDGVVDGRDACPGTPPGTVVNASGCPLGACFPPPAGMTNWFPGDGNANDRQGSNNGTPSGGVTFPAGKVAQAFSFDGTGEVTYSTINTGAAYTVDFWVRPTRSFGYENLVSNSHRDGTQNYGQLYFVNDRVEYWQGGTFRAGSLGGSASLDTYVHVGLTYDGSVNRLYLNGNLAATSGTHPGETFNNQIRLGNSMDNSDLRFAGQIDEVEIFSRALSQTELRGIFNADTAGTCTSQNLQLMAAASRKTQGGLGPFDINLPLTGTPGVECRNSGGNHTLVFSFTNNVVSGNASVTSGTGVAESPTFAGNTMTVNLTGVANAQTVTLTLSNVTDSFAQVLPNTLVDTGFLAGDTNSDRTVNSGDTLQTRNRSGQTAAVANFRSDVNVDGVINSGDTLSVRARSGTFLP